MAEKLREEGETAENSEEEGETAEKKLGRREKMS